MPEGARIAYIMPDDISPYWVWRTDDLASDSFRGGWNSPIPIQAWDTSWLDCIDLSNLPARDALEALPQEALVEACPGRFKRAGDSFYDDLFGDWVGTVISVDVSWLIGELNATNIAAIYKLEGKSWEESILNAIMHWHQTNKEGK